MPISNKDLGKYKRPGIFIEEIDTSFIERPVQEQLINLVPGFSKKGPFNKPVKIENPTQFETIYGPVDKNLENKGSFFHRFVIDMLKVGPVYALNLLKTDPSRDQLEWQSISVSAQYDNGPKNLAPYERFFNRQDFWERDVESFMDIIDQEFIDHPTAQPNPAHDLLSITNMSDKKITVFVFKSSVTGFDLSAEAWYGGIDKVPLFMNPKDYISDYMVSVLAIGGDFGPDKYSELSVDNYWGKYFSANGLIKTKVQDFVNDYLTTLVAFYDVCLIPNFRDLSGRDMYIKTVINAATESTGLFCYYNEEYLLNSDFYRGNIDTIGATLVVTEDLINNVVPKTAINFMSYNTSLTETVTYAQKDLDTPLNVFGNLSSALTDSSRTATHTNWFTNIHPTSTNSMYTSIISSITDSEITIGAGSTIAVDDIIYFSKSFSLVDRSTPYYVLSVDGGTVITISTSKGGVVLGGLITPTTPTFIYSLKQVFTDSTYKYNLNSVDDGYTLTNHDLFFEPFVINNSAQTYSRYDIVYLSSDYEYIHTVKGSQSNSTASEPAFLLNNNNNIILGYYKIDYTLSGNTIPTFAKTYYPVTVNETGYLYLANNTDLVAVTGVSNSIKYLDLYFIGTSGATSYTDYKKMRKLKIFTELYTKILTGKSVIINITDSYKFPITATVYEATATTDAHITIWFDASDVNPSLFYSDGKFLIYYTDDELYYNTTLTSTLGLNTTLKPKGDLNNTGGGIVAKYSTLYQDYFNGVIGNGDYIYFNNTESSNTRYYLKMYLNDKKELNVRFAAAPEDDPNVDLSSIQTLYKDSTNTYVALIVHSNKGSYKQTLEIENVGYISDFSNVNYVYVDKIRYSEVSKGWYLEAYYDTDYYTTGEGYVLGSLPRKLVRVIKSAVDTVDPMRKILYTDGPIRILKTLTGGTTYDYYVNAYMSIDNYATEYHGISLKPFVVHQDSMPNGTDARLNDILSVVAKETNLAKGLANKNRIVWRYLVDSFGLGLTENSKQAFVDLCGLKLNCFGFINMPSVRQFKTSLNPSFINPDRTINTEYVKEGGNPDLNPSFLYSFGEGVGRSCVGYFFPYVKDSNDSAKFIPPAAKVAKTYMKKFSGGLPNAYPWQIVAGPQFSLITDINELEMRLTNDDLENFYAMGANPIVYTLSRGFNINSENTAQVFPLSSLSYIHSREVLIELENRLYDMLLNYHWRFNTPEIRAEIKFRADQICKELLDNDALYDFKNVFDKTNNTDYIIDMQMGVLDTYIEIIKGMGIIVNNITILKKGTISSGGFLPV